MPRDAVGYGRFRAAKTADYLMAILAVSAPALAM